MSIQDSGAKTGTSASNSLVPSQPTTELALTPEERMKLVPAAIESSMSIFNYTGQQLQDAMTLAGRYRLKHGLTASVPIICKANQCPYLGVCTVPQQYRVPGSRCMQEVTAMITRFETLCAELGVTENDGVDIGLVKDVVDLEMMIIRADNKFAQSGDILVKTIAAVDNQGREHYEDGIDPVITLKLNLIEKRMKILEKLNSTRKDKVDELKKKKDPSVKAASLMAKARFMTAALKDQVVQQSNPVIDVDDSSIVKEESIEYTEIEINDIDELEEEDIINNYDDEEAI